MLPKVLFCFLTHLEIFGEECLQPRSRHFNVLPPPVPSFVLLFELGPLEEHCKVPLLGLQGPFSVQLMSHK